VFFWYLGAGCALLLLTLGPRRIDYRLALLGLVLPLGDIVIRTLAFPHSRLGVHLYLHTFLFALVLALVVMTFLRGPAARRWFVVPMAIVIHLLLAGMLGDPVGLFWPLLGSHFARLPAGVHLAARVLPLGGMDIVKEVLGLGALVYIAFAFGLDKPRARRDFLRSGTLSARGQARNLGPPAVEWGGSWPGDRGPGRLGAEEGPGSTGQGAG
jgi:membrane-bound metal-dependent hydrolase YbcI (DUF457 family)